MIETQKKINYKHIAMIAGLAFVVMLPIFYNGIPLGNDLSQHFQFAQTIHKSITSGEIYPSFDADFNQQYGDYGIRFYPPAAYYLLAITYSIFGNWFFAAQISFYLIFFLSGIGTYLWAREEFSDEQSLIAAALFIFAPYHINQIYNNFLYAEFASMAVIPFCFLFITRICKRNNLSSFLGLSIAYALLILTHLPLTIIGSIALGIYGLAMINREKFFKNFIALASSACLGVAASSFYWIKIVTEKDWLNHSGGKYFLTIYSYLENFLFRPQNFLNFYTDASCLWLGEIMLLSILFISIPSTIFILKDKTSINRFASSVAIVLLVSLFMISPLSIFIWNNLDFLQKVQFPWRWLGIASLSGSIFASIGIIKLAEKLKTSKSVLLQLGVVFIFLLYSFSSILIIKQAEHKSFDNFNSAVGTAPNQSSFDCWWTIWAKSAATGTREKVVVGNRKVEISTWDKNLKEFTIEKGDETSARVAFYYYPHWKASINNELLNVQPSADGAILIQIPQDAVKISLRFEEPKFVKACQIISLLALLIMAVISIKLLLNGLYFDRLNR